jgi:cytochrome c-type biogenesis protein CcmH
MSMFPLRIVLMCLALLVAGPALAVHPDEILKDAGLEARARNLSRELRCMVCQNQSIDDSDAPLARDLRLLVRERLQAGDSDMQVIDFLTERYGDFVLLKPRLTAQTALLWVFPALVLVCGGVGLVLFMRRQRRNAMPRNEADSLRTLTADEQKRLAELVDGQR